MTLLRDLSGELLGELFIVNFEKTFENAAKEYDSSRPMYVKDLYNDLFKYKSVDSNSSVLEIGIGSGKASKPILDIGCRLIGIEPGENLAAMAKAVYRNP